MSRRPSFALIVCSLFVLGGPQPATPQSDPLALQTRAIDRIDAVVDHFRKTGDFRSRVGDLAQAGTELSESNRILAARGDWAGVALGLIKQGHVYRMQAQWADAIALYQRAEEAAMRAGSAVRRSEALAYRALAESSRTNLGPALAVATQAMQVADTTTDKDAIARALDVLAGVQLNQGDLAGSAATVSRQLAAASQAPDPMAIYYAYSNRSEVYLKTAEKCDFQRAFEPCYEALDRSRDDLQQTLAIARKFGYLGLVRNGEQSLRDLETRRQMIKSQESMHRNVQSMKIFHPTRAADVLVTNRFVAPPDALPAAVLAAYQAAKRQEKDLGAFADVAEGRTYFTEGSIAEMQGNNDAALASFRKAIDVLERDRRALRDERSRGTFSEDRIGFYYAAIQQLLERRRDADAFELLERSRSRALADLLASRTLGLGRPEEQRLYAGLALLRTQIADAQSRLFELASQADAAKKGSQLAELQREIKTLEDRYQTVASRVAADAPRLQNLVTAAPVALAALQQSMREEHYEMLQYLVLEHAVLVWHIGPSSIAVRNVFLPRSEVMAKVALLQKSLARRDVKFDEKTARELFLFLIQPFLPGSDGCASEGCIRSEKLVIVPHEDLQYVPFQVFQDPADGRYLGERFQITYAPSASVLLTMKRPAGLSGARLLAVANPEIPAATREVRAIAALFPGRSKVVSDTLARESDVKTWVRDFDVLHLAVHGVYDPGEPMLSRVLLGQSAADDGRLTAAEMFGLPLDGSLLVVLSACETGRAEATHGNEILGIERALIYAGAGTLVLSHWQVDSDATALWMQTFYQAALSRPMAEAARLALVKVKSNPQYIHPYFWSAFTMVGR
jgi:CHAT domain-containing protein